MKHRKLGYALSFCFPPPPLPMYLAFYWSFSSFLLLQVSTPPCFWMFLLQCGSSMGYSCSSPLLQKRTFSGCQPLWGVLTPAGVTHRKQSLWKYKPFGREGLFPRVPPTISPAASLAARTQKHLCPRAVVTAKYFWEQAPQIPLTSGNFDMWVVVYTSFTGCCLWMGHGSSWPPPTQVTTSATC